MPRAPKEPIAIAYVQRKNGSKGKPQEYYTWKTLLAYVKHINRADIIGDGIDDDDVKVVVELKVK